MTRIHRKIEIALLFAFIAALIWLTLRPEPSISTLLSTLEGRICICTPSRLRSCGREPEPELPPALYFGPDVHPETAPEQPEPVYPPEQPGPVAGAREWEALK